METRTISKRVTFANPFQLPGLDGIQPPGTYTMNLEEEQVGAFSFVGWRQVAATLELTHRGTTEHAAIDLQDLRDALVRDSDQSTNPPTAPATALAQIPRKREMIELRARHR